ncbi:MAG: hypothetical protein IPI60_06010 [Saprospiraceae bacterium]|nr:hypothetical protein [Saprospiraceae bacterium]
MDEIAKKDLPHTEIQRGQTRGQNVYDNWLDSIRDILDDPDKDALDFINDFKTNLFNEEVYVYTPKGEMKILPKGATALEHLSIFTRSRISLFRYQSE